MYATNLMLNTNKTSRMTEILKHAKKMKINMEKSEQTEIPEAYQYL